MEVQRKAIVAVARQFKADDLSDTYNWLTDNGTIILVPNTTSPETGLPSPGIEVVDSTNGQRTFVPPGFWFVLDSQRMLVLSQEDFEAQYELSV